MMWRFLPLVGAVLFVGVVFCWRPWVQFRRHGTWGIILFRWGSLGQTLRDSLAVVLFVVLVGQGIMAAGWPETLSFLGAERGSALQVQQLTGAVLLFGGIILLVTAQLDLGASWRIGIEQRAKPGLITSGLYCFCRNPIFLALVITVAGYMLLLPTRLSLVLLLGTFIGVRQQVAAEEAYLLHAYGDSYREYVRRVGRFLPGLGKIR
jgi:protein-S-isoprenylcysteine O-methyltransferase Ste14